MAEFISVVLLFINIVGGGLLCMANAWKAIKNRKEEKSWTTWIYSLLGLYWAISYSILVFVPLQDKYAYTSEYIRPSISLLIVLMLIDSIPPKVSLYLPDIFRKLFAKIKKGKKYAST